MNTETLIDIIKRVWTKAMPKVISAPNDYNLFLWSKRNLDDVAYAINRTGEKMSKNLSEGQPVSTESAERYTTSILASRTEWRRLRQAPTEVQAEVNGNK